MLSHQRLLKCGVSHVQRINARIRKHGAERPGKGSSPRRQCLFRLNSHLFEFDSRPLVESVCAGGVEVLGEEGGEEAEIWLVGREGILLRLRQRARKAAGGVGPDAARCEKFREDHRRINRHHEIAVLGNRSDKRRINKENRQLQESLRVLRGKTMIGNI
jgi:hypothetical protein